MGKGSGSWRLLPLKRASRPPRRRGGSTPSKGLLGKAADALGGFFGSSAPVPPPTPPGTPPSTPIHQGTPGARQRRTQARVKQGKTPKKTVQQQQQQQQQPPTPPQQQAAPPPPPAAPPPASAAQQRQAGLPPANQGLQQQPRARRTPSQVAARLLAQENRRADRTAAASAADVQQAVAQMQAADTQRTLSSLAGRGRQGRGRGFFTKMLSPGVLVPAAVGTMALATGSYPRRGSGSAGNAAKIAGLVAAGLLAPGPMMLGAAGLYAHNRLKGGRRIGHPRRGSTHKLFAP